MKTVQIDDDIYAFLVSQTKVIGESASSILRRVLAIEGASTSADEDPEEGWISALADFLTSTDFQRLRNVTDRYLAILGELYRRHGDEFAKVLEVAGRKRSYFGRSAAEVEASGRSLEPRLIPGSDYWAMTNASTDYKREILEDVLRQFGYSALDLSVISASIAAVRAK